MRKTELKRPEHVFQQLASDVSAARQVAGQQYGELLLRGDAPEPGDAEALAGVMKILGRGLADLEGDAELVEQVVAHEQANEDHVPELKAAGDAARAIIAERNKKRAALEAEYKPKVAAAEAALRSAQAAGTIASQIRQTTSVAVDKWKAIVAGCSTDELRAARRAAARAASPPSPPSPPDRGDVIRNALHEHRGALREKTRGNPMLHVAEVEHVNLHLSHHGAGGPATEKEIERHQIKTEPQVARPPRANETSRPFAGATTYAYDRP
jgi:hypothetical protein